MRKILKKGDFLLLFFFLAAAALIAAVSLLRPAYNGLSVCIITGNTEYGIYPINKDKEIRIERNGHLNIVVIEDETVRMEYSDCRNQICVNTGVISGSGDLIVCLPNEVIVEIIGNEEGGDADDSIDAVVK